MKNDGTFVETHMGIIIRQDLESDIFYTLGKEFKSLRLARKNIKKDNGGKTFII